MLDEVYISVVKRKRQYIDSNDSIILYGAKNNLGKMISIKG